LTINSCNENTIDYTVDNTVKIEITNVRILTRRTKQSTSTRSVNFIGRGNYDKITDLPLVNAKQNYIEFISTGQRVELGNSIYTDCIRYGNETQKLQNAVG
jgi:hypothetical protein